MSGRPPCREPTSIDGMAWIAVVVMLLSSAYSLDRSPFHEKVNNSAKVCFLFGTDAVAGYFSTLDTLKVEFVNQFVDRQLLV